MLRREHLTDEHGAAIRSVIPQRNELVRRARRERACPCNRRLVIRSGRRRIGLRAVHRRRAAEPRVRADVRPVPRRGRCRRREDREIQGVGHRSGVGDSRLGRGGGDVDRAQGGDRGGAGGCGCGGDVDAAGGKQRIWVFVVCSHDLLKLTN